MRRYLNYSEFKQAFWNVCKILWLHVIGLICFKMNTTILCFCVCLYFQLIWSRACRGHYHSWTFNLMTGDCNLTTTPTLLKILNLLLLIFMMQTIFVKGSVKFFLQVIIRFKPLWHTVVCLACLRLYTMQSQLSQCLCSVTTMPIQPRQSLMAMHWSWNSRNLLQRNLYGLSMKSFMIQGEEDKW